MNKPITVNEECTCAKAGYSLAWLFISDVCFSSTLIQGKGVSENSLVFSNIVDVYKRLCFDYSKQEQDSPGFHIKFCISQKHEALLWGEHVVDVSTEQLTESTILAGWPAAIVDEDVLRAYNVTTLSMHRCT